MNDFSVDFYLIPGGVIEAKECLEVGYIVRASDIEEAIEYIQTKRKEEKEPWSSWNVFEFNIQRIETNPEREEIEACILSGPNTQELAKSERKSIIETIKEKIRS